MRHGKNTVKINKSTSHRRALWANMTISLVRSGQIKTTLTKAKLLRSYVEKLITRAKRANLADRRYLLGILYNDDVTVNSLINEVAEKSRNRLGGYTRVVKAGFRYGDAAPMAYIELVDREVIKAQ